MTEAINCIVGCDFGSNRINVRFDSKFHKDYFAFSCNHNLNESKPPFPTHQMDKEQAELLRNWIDEVLTMYDNQYNPCQNCFKSLPKIAGLDERGYWIVTCQHCNHEHEIGKANG